MLLSRASPHVAAGLTLLQLFGCIGLFLSVTLLLRVIVEILRPHHP